MSEVDKALGRDNIVPDFREMIDNAEYYLIDVVDGKFTARSTLVENWYNKRKPVIVIDNISKKKMLMTPFDMNEGVSDNVFKRSYHEGRFATLTFQWEPENPPLVDTEISKWSEALLQRFHWSWFNLLKPYLITDEFRKLNRYVNVDERAKGKTIWPIKENVYRAFSGRSDMLRVIIIGQDPYPNSHANGIAFATDQISKPISLRSIEKAIQKELEYPAEWMIQNDLMNVVNQGVLMLNSALTVEEGKPGSYIDVWYPFVKEVIKAVNQLPQPIIFLLMGGKARNFEPLITHKHVLTVEHPSAAARASREWESRGSFALINEHLQRIGVPVVKW
jgi:uracil-DNA glycosylase